MKFYTDGSYMPKYPNIVGYSTIIVKEENKEKYMLDIVYGGYYDDKPITVRQVLGEIMAATYAINYAIKNKIFNICICHDYTGIRHWALGEWKRNNEHSKAYHKLAQDAKELGINIMFEHVQAHNGDLLNGLADMYAKKGVYESDFHDRSIEVVSSDIDIDK